MKGLEKAGEGWKESKGQERIIKYRRGLERKERIERIGKDWKGRKG